MTQIMKPNPMDVLQLMTHNDLSLFKMKGSHVSLAKQIRYERKIEQSTYKKGVVFVSPSKEALSQGQGHIITSYETLHAQYDSLTHWTPNTFWGGTYYDFKNRIIKGHTKDNLKQINVIGFDIDNKKMSPYEIFIACDQEDLPWPNLVLETPNGYQGFFLLTTPFYNTNKTDNKALKVAERLSSNLLEGLQKHVEIDRNCTPFGFFRVPNDQNIVYFNDETTNTNELLEWSKAYEKKNKKKMFKVFNGGNNASALDYTSSDWYNALINAKHINTGNHSGGRNNTLLTLALAAYASDKTFEEAYDQLDQFNSNLDKPLSKRDFEKTLKSAYSGKYKGPKRAYVEGLLELWSNKEVKFHGKEGWYKFKRDREDRTRSHYDEREEDIVNYLNGRITPENPFLEGSLKDLATTLGMAVSSLKEVLKRSKLLVKNVVGAGRGAVTMITTKIMYLRYILRNQKERMQQQQLSYQEFLMVDEIVRDTFSLSEIDVTQTNLEMYMRETQSLEHPTSRSG